ncbi:hypothetical protein COV06_00030 [Candidatus Uhrbacteria bacterium CG10_big_fil_rev_8_21_14_0_10_50_16]|uniref:Undecaprenyl-phosphate alpha-N-acetylglucosaminyl 1-phosphate transferase n=1 Tax=Candidatus Uhrbacteria bacterium CG10_big_fil_rev_8_21_14_0_10_50_16 TaxID=1975039 RepID=A0A2H0RMT5_9BACT|nr:MAG: hypothetical protein COV06_00030 [Candidatus Uhrbacteria bacterium CG10_big_fil_rev_8_21_14_0_10_50_16]
MTWLVGGASFLLAASLAPMVGALATRWGIVDHVKERGRKVHRRTTPLMGGVAVLVATIMTVLIVLIRSDLLTSGRVTTAHYVGLLLAGCVLMIGGVLDDKYNLSPKIQLLFPVAAALVAIAGGLGIEKITNPFGGFVWFETVTWNLFALGPHMVAVSWPGDVFVFLWLLGMMFTVKLLDGLDGLATSIGSVGVLMVLLLAGTTAYFQPDVVVLSAIILGAFLGFLVWNVHPAQLFLGEGGALLVGFFLGALAIISGGKIATLLLVMGIPILDVAWVMFRRLRSGKDVSKGDRLHLHHRLYDFGLSQRQVVGLYTLLALGFGSLTLVLPSFAKLIALVCLMFFTLIGAYALLIVEGERR